jgi:NADPH2:quinone reductase
VTSVVAPDYFLEPGEFGRVAGLVLDQVASGTLEVPIAGTFPLDEAARAHHLEESPATSGKVILLP